MITALLTRTLRINGETVGAANQQIVAGLLGAIDETICSQHGLKLVIASRTSSSVMRRVSRAAEPPALPPVVPSDSGAPAPTQQQPQQQLLPLPEFEWPSQVNESAMFEPPVLVAGMLHQGNKLVIGGGSKSYKTWCLTDLAISVAAGVPWIGLPCVQGVVLYINFEIQPVFFHKRIGAICRAKSIPKPPNLAIWNLRGQCYDLRQLLPITRQRLEALKARGTPVSLIILDPIYKSLGGRDENSAGDIGQLLLEIESLAEQTDAAVACHRPAVSRGLRWQQPSHQQGQAWRREGLV